jgi:hypothetical protein
VNPKARLIVSIPMNRECGSEYTAGRRFCATTSTARATWQEHAAREKWTPERITSVFAALRDSESKPGRPVEARLAK